MKLRGNFIVSGATMTDVPITPYDEKCLNNTERMQYRGGVQISSIGPLRTEFVRLGPSSAFVPGQPSSS